MGALENAKVTLYLDDKSEPIASTDVEADGSYVLKFSPEVEAKIVQNNYALLSAESNGTTLKSIVTFYDANNSDGYAYKDTVISSYTNAIYKVKSALQFDKNATKMLVEKFMPLYNEGQYDTTKADAYAFAYNGVMDELAQHPEYDKTQTFETLKKLSVLNKEDVEVAKENGATDYGFVVVKTVESNEIAVQELKFNIKQNLNLLENESTQYNFNIIKLGKSSFFDAAKNYKVITDNNTTLFDVKVNTYDSNLTVTELDIDSYMLEYKRDEASSIIKNLKLGLDFNNIFSKENQKIMPIGTYINEDNIKEEKDIQKGYNDCSAEIYEHLAWDTATVYHEEWRYVKKVNHAIFNNKNDLHLNTLSHYYGDGARSYMVVWRVVVDGEPVKLYTSFIFDDYNNMYKNATIAKFLVGQTWYNSKEVDNNYVNKEYEYTREKIWVEPSTPSHSLMDFDKIVKQPIGGTRTTAWRNSKYALNEVDNYIAYESSDTRLPLLLIHGWQAIKADSERNQAVLRDYEHNEFEYWHNFISYYLTTPELYTRYKLYTYHYPSYKHITYNARRLRDILKFLKNNNNTLIGQALNNGDGLTIIGHSMGGLVARSMIEEHLGLDANAEELRKLITLDTPHHGSHGANQAHWRTNVADFLSIKDLGTAGSVDLIWDNYDKYYSCIESNRDCVDYQKTLNINNGDSRFSILGDRAGFDKYYYHKLNNLGNTDAHHDLINPFLTYLNRNYFKNWADWMNSYNQKKYIFYIAHTQSNRYKINPDNPIETAFSYKQSTDLFNGHGMLNSFKDRGYGSGGAEPVCSAFLTLQDKPDKVTRFSGKYKEVDKFIKINNVGDVWNNYIPYRYFWDYDHQSMLAGRAKGNGSWDKFIDDKPQNRIGSNDCSYSTYFDFSNDSGCATHHYNYYKYALRFLTNRNIAINQKQLFRELPNPLISEPVFMVLQKDLLDNFNGL
jgi:pimeloyl-ACP methyl ester carboxylesterase